MSLPSRDASPLNLPVRNTGCSPSDETLRVLAETFSVIRTPFAAWKGIEISRVSQGKTDTEAVAQHS